MGVDERCIRKCTKKFQIGGAQFRFSKEDKNMMFSAANYFQSFYGVDAIIFKST